MERAPGDDWLQDNDSIAWGARPSSVPAFINTVVVQNERLEGHLLEHAIAELGKNDRITEGKDPEGSSKEQQPRIQEVEDALKQVCDMGLDAEVEPGL